MLLDVFRNFPLCDRIHRQFYLVFAIATTTYIFVAIQLEERDLVNAYGDEYKRYQQSVPMIVPVRIGKGIAGVPVTSRRANSA